MKRKFSFRLGKLIPSKADEVGTETNIHAATNTASSPLIDRGPPLDVEVETELKSACALIAEGLKPKRERPNDRDRRKVDAAKHTKQRQTKHKNSNSGNEPITSSAAAGQSHSAANAEPVVYHIHREVNSNVSPPKPRRIIKDQFPELDDSSVAVPAECSTCPHRDVQSRHVSDVPSVSPHADYHQFIRTIGPRSVTDSQRTELDPKPKEFDSRKSFESTSSMNSIISPPVPPPIVEEMPLPPRKKSNKPRLYLEQALIPARSAANTVLPPNGHERQRTRDTLPIAEERSSGMVMKNCDHTFEEVRQERQSITRPMSAQSVRPKREVPHSRSSSAVGWHEPTLNNESVNRYPTSIYLKSSNDRTQHTNDRSISPMHDSRPKPVQKVDLNRALPPLPKTEQWEDYAAYPRRSNHRTHIASLMQPEHRDKVTATKQPTDGQLYWQIMSRIEEIKRAPVDAPPPPKDGAPPPKAIRRPFSALNYHASLREIEYGKRLNERSSRAAKQRRKPEQQPQPQLQPQSKATRTGLPKALDPAVPLSTHGVPLAASNKTAGVERSSSLRAKTPSRRGSNNRPERSKVNHISGSNALHGHNINKDRPRQNLTKSHSNNLSRKPSAKHSYSTTPAKVAIRAGSNVAEINNLLKPKVLAELGYTRHINLENPGTWSTDESYNGSGSYGNSSGGKVSSSSNINISNNNNIINNENNLHYQKHDRQNSNQFMAVKRVLEHVALGRMRTKAKPMSKSNRAREEIERNKTWMDRIESQGVKAGVMFLDDAANAPVVRF